MSAAAVDLDFCIHHGTYHCPFRHDGGPAAVVFRAVLLCSRPGLRHGCYWEIIGPPFSTESEAVRRCVFVFGLGGCVEWTVEREVSS